MSRDREKKRLYDIKYRKENKAKILAYSKKWKAENPEKSRRHRATYEKNNKIERYKKHLEWLRRNPEKVRKYYLNDRKKHYKARINSSRAYSRLKSTKKRKKEWRFKNHEKTKAHYLANYAVKKGIIKRLDKCQKCGFQGYIEMHHEDYSKPYDITFLCRSCHGFANRLRQNK